MKDSMYRERIDVPVVGEYDVIVIGGGVAGISAALAAKRLGANTLLIEKSVMLGGLATLGHVVIYLPLCDGYGRQVTGGIAEELLHVSIRYGYDNLPGQWKTEGPKTEEDGRYQTVFNAPAFAVALDELLEEASVDLLFDTVFSRPVIEDGRCTGVIVENKSGRQLYRGRAFVDASGDADLVHRAGADCADGPNWLSYWAYDTNLAQMERAAERNSIMDAVRLATLGASADGKGEPVNSRRYHGISACDVTEFVMAGRRLLRDKLLQQENHQYSVLALPGMAQFRTTRRIQGRYTLTADDVFAHFPDSIGCVGDWRTRGPVFEIPFRALLPQEIANVIAAGRIISSQGDAWEITRVIPAAALTGQAAGTAAYLAVDTDADLVDTDVSKLQRILERGGVRLHCQDP